MLSSENRLEIWVFVNVGGVHALMHSQGLFVEVAFFCLFFSSKSLCCFASVLVSCAFLLNSSSLVQARLSCQKND